MRLSDILYRHNKPAKRHRARPEVGLRSDKSLTRLVQDSTKEDRLKHFRYLDWRRAFLSKSRYMCGLQCPKKLWQAVYDPQPAEEPLPGTTKGMGIEVGIKARLLWPGGVLVDDPEHRNYDAAVRRTKTLIADPAVPAILEATLVYDGVLVRVDALERLPDGRWRVNEVKSSTRIKEEHLEDLPFKSMLLRTASRGHSVSYY